MRFLLPLSLILGLTASSQKSDEGQGYDIMIHAIPHTHLDAGWIENIETYYNNYVVEIFRTLIPELEANPHYRFNWAEVGYL